MRKIAKTKVTNVRPKRSNVEFFTGVTRLDFSPDMILSGALSVLDSVVVLGYDKDGEFFFSCSNADGADALWLMEKAKRELLDVGDSM